MHRSFPSKRRRRRRVSAFLPIVSGTFSAGGPRLLAVGPDQTSTAADDADAAAAVAAGVDGVAADNTRRARRRDT